MISQQLIILTVLTHFKPIFLVFPLNPFHATGLFRYPLKTENQRCSDVFRVYRKIPVAWNGLKTSAKQRFCDIFGEHRNGTLAWNRLSFKVSNLQNDQTHSICWLLPNSLSLFGDFVGLARKGLSIETYWSNSRKKKINQLSVTVYQ